MWLLPVSSVFFAKTFAACQAVGLILFRGFGISTSLLPSMRPEKLLVTGYHLLTSERFLAIFWLAYGPPLAARRPVQMLCPSLAFLMLLPLLQVSLHRCLAHQPRTLCHHSRAALRRDSLFRIHQYVRRERWRFNLHSAHNCLVRRSESVSVDRLNKFPPGSFLASSYASF